MPQQGWNGWSDNADSLSVALFLPFIRCSLVFYICIAPSSGIPMILNSSAGITTERCTEPGRSGTEVTEKTLAMTNTKLTNASPISPRRGCLSSFVNALKINLLVLRVHFGKAQCVAP
jgi:hypothetical protein